MGFTGGYYTGGGNSAGTVMAILLLLAVVLTVLAFIFIVPENRREKLSAFGKFLHDTCNFNYLLIEKILQALYIFLTVFAILMGLYTLVHNFWVGLALTIIMPIAIRLIYEFLMMAVLLLKHVIMIDNKLKNQNTAESKGKGSEKPSPTPAPAKPAVKKAAPAAKPAAEKTTPAAKPAAEKTAPAAKPAAPKPAPKAASVKAETETPVKTAPVKKTVPTETASEAPVKKAPAKPVVEKAAPAETASEPVSAPVKTEAPASPKARFCTECGSPLDENGKCPNCSK